MITAEEAQLVRFIFPGRGGGVGTVVLPWVPGKSLHRYLAEPPLSNFHLLGNTRLRIKDQHNRRVRSGYPLQAGDTITLRPVKRA